MLPLANPFRVLLTEIWRKRSDLRINLEQLDRSASHILDQLSKPAVRAGFEAIDLRAEPNVAPPIRWSVDLRLVCIGSPRVAESSGGEIQRLPRPRH